MDGKRIVTVLENDGSKTRKRFHHGIIAQQLEEVIQQTGIDFGGFQDLSRNNGPDFLKINYNEFIGPLIKSVQELNSKIDRLTTDNDQMKEEIKLLKINSNSPN